jgi:proteasome lid subunit RPN8/RPN11
VSGEPIAVRVHQGVLDRIAADYALHRRSSAAADETGWIPVGRVEADGAVVVSGLLPKGPGSVAGPGSFEIDHVYVYAALLLHRSRSEDGVVGLIHSHPGRMDYNSAQDVAVDAAAVLTLRGGVGVYPILVRDQAWIGHQLQLGARVSWWGMTSDRPGVYVPCRPRVLAGEDDAGWIADYEHALVRAAELVTALCQAGLGVSVQPVAGQLHSLDVIARFGDHLMLRRYDPFPGAVSLLGPAGGLRLVDADTDPAELAAQVADALAALEAETAPA